MFLERRLDHWASQIRDRHPIPLRVRLWNGNTIDLGAGATPSPTVLHVPSEASLRRILPPSLDALAKAYVEGDIEVEGKLTEVVDAAWALARSTAQDLSSPVRRAPRRFRHALSSDKRDIRYHYDIGNHFYRPWLGEQMVYSCAYWEREDMTLDEAQLAKIDHILTKLRVQPGDRLLDVGCGWGALVVRAATKFGATCHGVTLSVQQYQYALRRVRQLGLEGRVTIEHRDYRELLPDLEQSFDRIASVDMFEHVGLGKLPLYFSILRRLLRDGGTLLNDGITSTDPDDAAAPFGAGEFIGEYVFPHGELPHIGSVLRHMQTGGLEPCDVESLRRHYAKTLSTWAQNFEEHREALVRLAGEKRCRIWRIYLAGCARAFADDWVSVFQVLACKAGGGGRNRQPMTRDWMYANSPAAARRGASAEDRPAAPRGRRGAEAPPIRAAAGRRRPARPRRARRARPRCAPARRGGPSSRAR